MKNGSQSYHSKALIDSGSELHIMSRRCYHRLKLKGEAIRVKIVGAGGVVTEKRTERVDVIVVDSVGIETEVECIVIDKPCGRLLPLSGNLEWLPYNVSRELQGLQDGGDIDIIIGMATPKFHRQETIMEGPNNLYLIQTPFGQCVVGPAPKRTESNPYGLNYVSLDYQNAADDNIIRNLEMDSVHFIFH